MSPITPTAVRTVWNGIDLLNALEFATRWLDHNRDHVNALNVFPIPDGDTGTNMALTMHASLDGGRTASNPTSAGDVAARFAYGALMGARGNSGVILSQIFRGFSAAITGRDEIDGEDLARALDGAREMAYKAVLKPVEGTMLTIIRAAADSAATASSRTPSIVTVLRETLEGARVALADTPNQLDILRQAGVVDAGGQGIVHILEGLTRFAQGDTIIEEGGEHVSIGAEMRFLDDIAETHGEDSFGYCTNFMVFGSDLDFEHVRDEIAAMGQSAVIVGDDSVVKVHIHTENPGAVLEYALTLGYLDQIKIDNMSLQTEALSDQRLHAKTDDGAAPAIDGAIGILAVAAGQGLADALTSMGAHRIVPGGQTMNPSTEQLLHAVREMPVDEIVILPNNKNIIMAANQVSPLTDKTIRVIPSRSLPQGLAALASFSRDASLEANIERMNDALEDVQAVEITRAVRDVDLHGVTVTTGDLIGMVNGDLTVAGTDLADVLTRTLRQLGDIDPELLTVFTGEGASTEETSTVEQVAGDLFPDAEIEIIDGGQPHYQYVIGIE